MRVGSEFKRKVLSVLQADLIEQEEMLANKLKQHKATNSDSDSDPTELNEMLIKLSNEYVTNRDYITQNYQEPELSIKLNELKAIYDKQKQNVIYGNT